MSIESLLRAAIKPEHHAAYEQIVGNKDIDLAVLTELYKQDLLSTPGLVAAASALPVQPSPPRKSRRYVRHAKIGEGGMGQVFLVEDTDLARVLAQKTLHESVAHDPHLRAMFGHEACITAQLEHPGIVSVNDAQLGAKQPTYSMQLVAGDTLSALIYAPKPKDETAHRATQLGIFIDVCDAIAYAHERGIVHRDLKPDNIMVGAFGRVVVLDWGIAMAVHEASDETKDALDRSNVDDLDAHATGTPAYMSPEQARGEVETLDGRSDQYALGLILQEMLTRQRALVGKTAVQTLLLAQEGRRTPIKALARPYNVPRELVAIINKATTLRRRERYVSVADLADDVRRYLRDEPVVARPDTLGQRMGRTIARHRSATLLGGTLLLLAIALLVLLGVTGGVVVNEVNRALAEQRQAELSQAQQAVGDQAQRIDGELLRLEGLLRGVAGAAETALLRAPPDVVVYQAPVFRDPNTAPPDLKESTVYDGKASLAHADVVVSDGVDPLSIDDDMRRLASLTPALRDALVRSLATPPPTAQGVNEQLLTEAAPLVWSYVATESGALAGYPGTGFYPDDYDARKRDWYTTSIGTTGPQWSAIDADESGLGLLITASMELRSPQGETLGVAAVDMTFGHLIGSLLEPSKLEGRSEAWLIDASGSVIVRSSQKDLAAKAPADWTQEPFPYDGVLETVRNGGGHAIVQLDGERSLALSKSVPEVGWTYLVTIPTSELNGWW